MRSQKTTSRKVVHIKQANTDKQNHKQNPVKWHFKPDNRVSTHSYNGFPNVKNSSLQITKLNVITQIAIYSQTLNIIEWVESAIIL